MDWLAPGWTGEDGVRALMTTRHGGVSAGPYESLNLRAGPTPDLPDDVPAAVEENRRRLARVLGARPVYLEQVHGADVVRLTAAHLHAARPAVRADAAVTTEAGVGCTVLVADCLPVLMCAPGGTAVGAAHAGWRGLAAGVLERTVEALCIAAGCQPYQVRVWMGACIGPQAFEVGADVLQAFGVPRTDGGSEVAPRHFEPRLRPDGQMRWRADLAGLARDRLRAAGVVEHSGGQWCTVSDPKRFFSYRRDRVTGRMAAVIARAL
ncbi:MAG: peptidoglycan editing factor PgeF [Aquabacterium sp.]|jgi:YfiH family protein|nr:peptidoglycan editing factor PgeF [Aquabacterium sp.]